MAKPISILVVVVLVASAFWYLINQWISSPTITGADWQAWIWPVIVLTLAVGILALAFMLLDDARWRWGAIGLANLAFVGLVGYQPMHWVAVLVMALLEYNAMANIAQEAGARLTINAKAIVKAGLSTIMMALLIGTSFAYYMDPVVQASAKTNKLPDSITQTIKASAHTYLAAQFQELTVTQRAEAERQVVQEIMKQLNAFAKPYIKYLPPILAFGLFLLLSSFTFIFNPVAAWVAMGLFWILRAVKFVGIEKKSVEAERLVM